MNKKLKLAKLLALLAIPAVIILLISISLTNVNRGTIIATVDGEKIYQDEVEEQLREMFSNTSATSLEIHKLPREIVEILVKDIFVQKELDKKIKSLKLIKSKKIKEKIEDYTQKITRQEYLESILRKRVSDEVLKNKYIELVNNLSGKKEIRIQHILVKSKAAANRILNKLKNNEPFKDLVQKYSIDNSTNKNGGDFGGYVIEDSLPKEFYEATSSIMKKGLVSKAVKTDYGWHIFKISDIRDAAPEPFESLKASLKEQLEREEIKKIFAEISDSAQIDILIDLKEIKDFNENAEESQTSK